VWKEGPEQQFLTLLCLYPLHPVDPLANSQQHVLEQHSITFAYFGDSKMGKKLVLEQLSITLGYFRGPQNGPKASLGATLHHFWLLWGPHSGPKVCF